MNKVTGLKIHLASRVKFHNLAKNFTFFILGSAICLFIYADIVFYKYAFQPLKAKSLALPRLVHSNRVLYNKVMNDINNRSVEIKKILEETCKDPF